MWRSLLTTTAPLSSAAFGDFSGDSKTDAFFANGTRWSIVQSYSPRVTLHYTQPYKLSELRFGNFVGDAKLDVLRSTGSEWLVWDRVSPEALLLQRMGFPNHLSTSTLSFKSAYARYIREADSGRDFVEEQIQKSATLVQPPLSWYFGR